MSDRRRVLWTAVGIAAAALATAGLYLISRGKWSDPIIDSGREWIVPDALARGNLLYRDVVYWFGPLTPYFHAGLFHLLGSSLETLVVAGIVASVGVLAALFFALRRVTGPREAAAWTVLALPALIFMPNAGGSLLGMGYRIWHAAVFAVLAIAVACRPGRMGRTAAAGALAALSGLCRTEWGIVALAVAGLCLLWRSKSASPIGGLGTLGASFLLLFGGSLGFFLWRAGPDAVLRDGHLLFGGLPQETRTFLLAFSGIADWRRGVVQLLYSAGMWLGAYLVADFLARGSRDPAGRRSSLARLFALLFLLAFLAAFGGASGAVLFSAAPLVCGIALLAAIRRGRGPRAAALAGFGLAGLILSYRRPFHIGDSAYVGPPLLFAFLSAAGLLQWAVAGAGTHASRARLRTALGGSLGLLVAFAYVGRALQYVSDDRAPIPGTGGMLSARPAVARELVGLATKIRERTAPDDSLIVFPEGEILNLLSNRANPIRHKLYIPGYLTRDNEIEILRELESAKPAAILIWPRPADEYGSGFFGLDYGIRIQDWIDLHCGAPIVDLSAARISRNPPRLFFRFDQGRAGSRSASLSSGSESIGGSDSGRP